MNAELLPFLLALALLQDPAPTPATPAPADGPGAAVRAEYTVRLVDPHAEVVTVEARFRAPAGRSTLELGLPPRVGFAALSAPRIEALAAAGPGTEGADAPPPAAPERLSPWHWRVALDAQGEARLNWRVPQDHRRLPAVRSANDAYEFPYVAPDHGLLVAGTLFLAPTEGPVHARARFFLPAGWDVVAPWHQVDPLTFETDDPLALADDLFAVGAWEVDTVSRGGFEALVAFAPDQTALRPIVVPPILRIVTRELERFGTRPRDRYLFLFGRADTSGFAGSPKTGSMSLVVPLGAPPDIVNAHVGHLIAHEFHHTWMRSIALLPGELRFYGEGFTDYVAYLVTTGLGITTLDEFRQEVERKLATYTDAAETTRLSLADAGGDAFFQDHHAYRQVYDGGLLLALLVDLELHAHGKDLAALQRRFQGDPRWRAGATPDLDALEAALAAELDAGEAARLVGLARGSEPIDFRAELARAGVEVERTEERAVEPLRANLQGTTLAEMDPDGTAARIGLTSGDRVIELNGVEVADAAAVRAAWMEAKERIRAVVERAGERVEIDTEIPLAVRYGLPPEALQPLL